MGIAKTAVFGILFVLFGVTYGKFFRSDYYYDESVSSWLKYNPVPAKWEDAVLKCQREGAMIASPLNEEFNRALSIIMMDIRQAPIFTGISNIYSKTVFQSMEGVPISNMCISWSTEPSAVMLASDVTCVAINANGTVVAVSCSELHPFVCYKKAGVELNECGPVDAGFTLNSQTGKCYKAVNELALWSDSYKICARYGAHLAVPNSEVEAKVIWDLAKKVISEAPKAPSSYINIGFQAWGTPRTWLTIHGQSLSEAGYAKWAPNEPSDPKERCGTMYVGGKFESGVLNDANCIYERKFVCELDPKAEENVAA